MISTSRCLIVLFALFFTFQKSLGQQAPLSLEEPSKFTFASLTGSPEVDTTGWNFIGNSSLGDTPGDTNDFNDEVILCPIQGYTSGAVFYSRPINLSSCSSWAAEFDYRISGGTGADGIAFCFLKNPPTGFVVGHGVGIPSKPEGLLVVLDTYNNCGGSNPELQIRYGNGVNNYSECPSPAQPTLNGLAFLRQNEYSHMMVTYDQGTIRVYINGEQLLEGFYSIDYTGFIGFTSGTGGSTDLHSITNFMMYTNDPLASVVLSESPVTFPETIPGESSTSLFTITNGGCDTLSISEIDILGDAFTMDAVTPKILSGGESWEIPVTFSPTQATAYSGEISLITNAGDSTIQIVGESCVGTPSITASALEGCEGDSILLTSNFSSNILWSTGETQESIYVHYAEKYTLTYNGPNQCSKNTDTISISFKKAPYITADPGLVICPGTETTLTIHEASLGTWATGDDGLSISVSPPENKTYYATATNDLGCNYPLEATVEVLQSEAEVAPSQLIPLDSATDLPNPVVLSWWPSSSADTYTIYLWKKGESQPVQPYAAGISQINYALPVLEPGITYQWQVVATNTCYQTPSIIQQFTTLSKPDLIVQNLLHSTPISGQKMEVSWTIANIGLGDTPSGNWMNRVWLSPDIDVRIGEPEDILLGTFPTIKSLASGESYIQNAEVVIPPYLTGSYYLFVITDDLDAVGIDPDTKIYRGSHGGKNVDVVRESQDRNNLDYVPITITIPPPPDLVVTDIYIPPNPVFSGENILVTFTVTNQGESATPQGIWKDQLFLSDTDELLPQQPLVGFTHHGKLLPGGDYTLTKEVSLPEGINGTYYIIVGTDHQNEIYEGVFDDNNLAMSEPIQVILKPNIDLAPDTISIPSEVSNSGILPITFSVRNKGVTDESITTWTDRLGLATNPNPDQSEIIWLTQKLHQGYVANQETYTETVYSTLPPELNGTYYVLVQTDADDVIYEYLSEDNNLLSSPTPVEILPADLIPSDIVLQAEAFSGDTVQVTWKVTNNGPGSSLRQHTDKFYLSLSAVLDTDQAVVIQSITDKRVIPPGESVSRIENLIIPDGITGTFYLFLVVDDEQEILEGSEDNNISVPHTLSIELSPYADLIPVQLTHGQAQAGNPLTITATVNNQGEGHASPQWVDYCYLSSDAILNEKEDLLLKSISNNHHVLSQTSYNQEFVANLPANLMTGSYYLLYQVDVTNAVYEYGLEGNNTFKKSIAVNGVPPGDLKVKSIQVPNEGNSGKTITIQYEITNDALHPIVGSSWFDGIYLSINDRLDQNDIKLHQEPAYGPIAAGEHYQMEVTLSLPNGIEGTYHLIVEADHSQKANDGNRYNNQLASTPIQISLSPWADLVVTEFSIPEEGIAGQPIGALWTVTNVGPATTTNTHWAERIYLSNDFVLDKTDRVLSTVSHQGALPTAASYSHVEEVWLPADVHGNFILIFQTDATAKEYEHGAEENNITALPITITQPLPADLQVTHVVAPEEVTIEQLVTIHWQLTNTGTNPVSGYMKDLLYLSENKIWEETDTYLGELSEFAQLPPGTTLDRELEVIIPGALETDYYIICLTDVNNNIIETDNSNNTGISETPVKVRVPELTLGETLSTTLPQRSPLYYKISIPHTLAGETLLIQLTSENSEGINELYLRHEGLPSRSTYDYNHQVDFLSNPELLVPELKAGTYYLLVYGTVIENVQQSITLTPQILNFAIRSVQSNQGGNTGKVTVLIEGSKFEAEMGVSLVGNNQTISAEEVILKNSAQLFATFNLNGVSKGQYHVVLTNTSAETATLESGFSVVAGRSPNILVNVDHPPSARIDREILMTIQFLNEGNVDVPIPVRYIISRDGASVALEQDELVYKQQSLEVELREKEGPPKVLRPGASGKILVYTKTNRVENVRFLLVD